MKRFLFFLIPVICLAFFSCKKDSSDVVCASLDGSWKMVLVKNDNTGTTMTKPASLFGDVVITFVSSDISRGIFNGNTPTNDLGPNVFSLGANNAINIPALGMTKVAETSWGSEFVTNIRDARRYSLDPGRLLIIVTDKRILTFQKL